MSRSKFLIASGESSADMLYASGFRAPDAMIFLQTKTKKLLLLSDLELDRGRQEAKVDRVDSFSEVAAAQANKKKIPSYARTVAAWLQKNSSRNVAVPADFPFGLARELKKEGIRLKPVKGSFFPERETKSPSEVRAIEAAIRIAETGMSRAMEILASASRRKDGRLSLGRKILTSEFLRTEIETTIVRAGGEARGDSIVAGGEQACDPHGRGSGPLRAEELIIIDIFPRDARSGYYGDITRTVVKGVASTAQRKLWETCLSGQKMAAEKMKPDARGAAIHDMVVAYFAEQGYPTERRNGRWQGFFHGTGHGLGLEIHEPPRFASTTFRRGQVITVEPGIYIPGLGGVRHEDVALITNTGSKFLTKAPKPFEI